MRLKYALVLLGSLGEAFASAPRLAHAAELVARGPAECADAVEIRFRVERSIGMPLADAAPLKISVEMEGGASGYTARIDVSSETLSHQAPEIVSQRRVLRASDCGQLAGAVSVAVALALGAAEGAAAGSEGPPTAVSGSESDVAFSPAPATPAAADSPAATPTDPAAPAPPAALVPSLSLWLLGDAGSLPAPSLGAALGAELGWRRFQLRALGSMLFEQSSRVESALAPGAGATLELLAGSLLGCTALFPASGSSFMPVACLGLEVGRLAGVGTGVAAPRRGATLWVAPRAELGAVWAVPGSVLRLAATLMAATPLNRDEFALQGIGRVHQPPSVIGRLSLGLGVGFD